MKPLLLLAAMLATAAQAPSADKDKRGGRL
jgi:hypothetical protein